MPSSSDLSYIDAATLNELLGSGAEFALRLPRYVWPPDKLETPLLPRHGGWMAFLVNNDKAALDPVQVCIYGTFTVSTNLYSGFWM